MKKKILAYRRLEQPVYDRLAKDYDVRLFVDPENDSDFPEFLRQAEGVIGIGFPGNAAILDKAPNLKIISNVSVGYNNLELGDLTKRGVMGTHTPGVLDDTVADMAMGLMLATARRMPELDGYVKRGLWKGLLPNEWYGVDVHHKTLGIIGMGRIGSAIAKRARFGFDMDILYHTRTRKPEAEERFDASYRDLDSLLKESDYVCLVIPLTEETRGMIGSEQFRLMKSSAIFLNISRGGTIIEEDLIDALQQNEIAAAGLDVFAQEPVDPENPLLQMKNVVTLPHIGSSTHETEIAMAHLAADNLIAGLEGNKPANLLNSDVL
ncbi:MULTISPECIES: D-glycerate dehydrogenase [unclassified Sporosarcina]|uniref:2-hydroxyacid dehydrogenase n=1 Tax=unclassified Sporosarcina TaxID=2647733 RepID=UPI000C16C621|nr:MULTISPECIES: D-glycerate dehydrogenase [unclassified Sporosarcina]PID06411.1 bifunctional glyoxylate/hydroxypyruvate reductase B [Sporosarcina sp. P30]PID09605.1 bifunctional glyoxylate/hydroxypyruvate reductase B [Sporosarcina sp. P31]PID13182.1 bifunctional glyoxylate/hydroxypyruvate reductase B [Sporosarcina sp. P32b]